MSKIRLIDRLDREHVLEAEDGLPLRVFLKLNYIPADAVIAQVNNVTVDDNTYIINPSDQIDLNMVRAYQLPEYCRTLRLWDDVKHTPTNEDSNSYYTKKLLFFKENGITDYKLAHISQDEFVEFIDEQFVQGILAKNLIEPNDTILLALSGGRDSLSLLYLLQRNKSKLPPFKLVGVTVADSAAAAADVEVAKEAIVAMGVDDYTVLSLDYLNETFNFKNGFEVAIERILKEFGRGRSIALWHCVMRACVERFAKERSIRKISFGYHYEDLFASVFRTHTLGVLFGESAPRKTWGDFEVVSPLWPITKKELTLYLKNVAPEHHSKQGSPTDYDRGDHNRDINYFIADLLSDIYPGLGFNMFESLERLSKNYEFALPNFYNCDNCSITFSDEYKYKIKKHDHLCSHCSHLLTMGEINPLKVV